MSGNNYYEKLGQPFAAEEINWRLQYVDKTKNEGLAVAYIDARVICERLDKTVGPDNWKDSYTPWHGCTSDKKQKSAQLCTIYIYSAERGEWIGKTDGAEDTDIEPVKGGLSDAFKRAAVKWNIGRYLYAVQSVWVKAKTRGGSYVIPDSERPKLDAAYRKSVEAIFKTPVVQTQRQVNTPAQNSGGQVFEIKNIHVQNNENGANSTLLLSTGSKNFTAVMNGRDDRLKIGSKITNVRGEQKTGYNGTYHILSGYDLAA